MRGGEGFGAMHDLFVVELGDALVVEAEHDAEDLGGVFADGGRASPDLSRCEGELGDNAVYVDGDT